MPCAYPPIGHSTENLRGKDRWRFVIGTAPDEFFTVDPVAYDSGAVSAIPVQSMGTGAHRQQRTAGRVVRQTLRELPGRARERSSSSAPIKSVMHQPMPTMWATYATLVGRET
jgi:hypothetical protein